MKGNPGNPARTDYFSLCLVLLAVSLTLACGIYAGVHISSYSPQMLKGRGLVILVIILMLLTFIVPAIMVLMRRNRHLLDPALPLSQPVQAVLDTLAEGVAIVDMAGSLSHFNKAFRQFNPAESGNILGKPLSGMTWLNASDKDAEAPWEQAMRTRTGVPGRLYIITLPGGKEITVTTNAIPILESGNELRGCLVSFNDITEFQKDNKRMHEMLASLAISREQVEQKNQELLRLATRDPLTGCYNRRAFSSIGEALFSKILQDGRNLCCIMADIDSFKRVNDTYGHVIGDQVIIEVSRMLSSHLRGGDLLCRYGGEEFCIVLPGASEEVAMEVAERLRAEIEAHVGTSLRTVEGLRVTSSFGVASLKSGADNLSELIELADFALYTSKRNGRNRATLWSENLGQETEDHEPSGAVAGNRT